MKAGADPKIRDKVGLSASDNPLVVKMHKFLLHKQVLHHAQFLLVFL